MVLATRRCALPRRGRSKLQIVLIVAIAGVPSCAPTIRRFTVLPHDVCKGTPVVAEWDVSGGRATISTDPNLPPQSGRTYVPATTTKFVLTVTPLVGKPVAKPNEVTVFTGTAGQPEPDQISFEEITCQAGQVTGTANRPFTGWDQRLTVGLVESGNDRSVSVNHEGRTAVLTTQEPTTRVFDGTKLGGTWTVSVPLIGTEKCDGTGTKPPDLVIVTAQVYCGS
jgi:hypothetical protein